MYVPNHFAETDLPILQGFIEQNGFGLLISQVDGAPFATHLPLLLDRSDGSPGTLLGHVARANPQWRSADGQTALAVFSGPHAYISPTWYEAEQVVPTWNYVAVHVYGRLRLVPEPAAVLEIVEKLVRVYEHGREPAWQFDADSDFARKMLAGIVGFRLEITRIEGKWKLSQNHPADRRKKVACALRQHPDENSQAIADLMEQALVGNMTR